MSNDVIRPGDRFLVECEVKTFVAGTSNAIGVEVKDDRGAFGCFVSRDFLLSGKRLPRPLKPGDKVHYEKAAGTDTIIAIHGEYAWVEERHGGDPYTAELSHLTPAEESAS